MAVFPKSETLLSDLAIQMINGLSQHGDLFPSIGPEAIATLTSNLSAFNSAKTMQADA